MPDPFELPRMLRAVVKLVRAHFALIHKHVALAFGHATRADQVFGLRSGWIPRFATVIGTLDDLPEPAAGLRRVDPVRIRGRAFEVIHLPAREVRPADFPVFARAVRREDERALLCADQYPD